MTAGYETEADIQEAFRNAGALISPDQLRRWRDQGLMPPVRQVGKGRAAGSVIHYPAGTAQLALEIQRLLAIKKKLSFVGWQLWLRGHDVADQYWKPATVSALAELKRIPAFLRLLEMRNRNKDETIFDQIEPSQFRNTPFAKGLAKLSPDMVALGFSLVADVAKGSFSQNQLADQSTKNDNRRAISKLIGQSARSTIAGIFLKPEFEATLEVQLAAVSDALIEIQKHPSAILAELTLEARGEFAVVLQFANQLCSVLSDLDKSPIGTFAKAIAGNQNAQIYGVLVWVAFRKMGTILDPSQIAAMAQNMGLKLEN